MAFRFTDARPGRPDQRAIYALQLALVLVFVDAVTIFIPQGEFGIYGVFTLAMMQYGTVPATVWLLLVGMGATAALIDGGLRPVGRSRASWRACWAGTRLPAGLAASPPRCR